MRTNWSSNRVPTQLVPRTAASFQPSVTNRQHHDRSTNSFDPGEAVYAAFASDETPNYSTGVGEAIIGWSHIQNGSEPIAYWGSADQHGYTKRGEMEVKNAGNSIYLIFDSTMNGAVAEENYGISNIEIWVK